MDESPYEIVQDERGLHVRCKFGVHVLTDEEAQRVREYVNGLEAENEALRELVRHLRECTRHNVCVLCEYADDACDFDYDLRKLGVEVEG